MFSQDVARVMPFRHAGHSNTLSVMLVGEADQQRAALAVLTGLGSGQGHNATTALSRAIDEIAKRLVWEGRVVYELVPMEGGRTHFHAVSSKGLIFAAGYVTQHLTAEDVAQWGGPRWRLARRSSVWHLDMAPSLGGRRGFLRMLNRLAKIERLPPSFWRPSLGQHANQPAFDLQAYAQTGHALRLITTREWGWSGRDWSSERVTEFYNVYRTIDAARARILLRDHIFAALQQLLERLGIDVQLQMKGMQTLQDLDVLRTRLLQGECGFSDVMDDLQ
ncbi:hypothetical protein [Cupriavidus metallidurans]|uniref:hypothetical protein n=1 Tax=Cupriavidus metallidurans TaxID=119219 RepID=UPI001CCF822C|nr:hypothetical protein [Cupriavidus metallidurans]UBM09384.1 hypothetical protein LAI70_05690 [Cupriavidus metallidurans]